MYSILVTEEVSISDKSNEVKDEQSLNKLAIFSQNPKSKVDKSNEIKDLHH